MRKCGCNSRFGVFQCNHSDHQPKFALLVFPPRLSLNPLSRRRERDVATEKLASASSDSQTLSHKLSDQQDRINKLQATVTDNEMARIKAEGIMILLGFFFGFHSPHIIHQFI